MSASHEQGALGASLSDPMTQPQEQGASAARTAETLAQCICHEEQMVIWSSEVAESLSMGGWLREHLSFEDKLDFYADLSHRIRDIVESAFALSASAPASGPERMVAGEAFRKAVAELSEAVTLAHDDYMRLGDYTGWNAIQSAEQQITKLLDAALATPAPATPPGVPDSVRAGLVEALAQHLHDEEHHLRGTGCWTWPEHANDEGYRGGGYVTITPTDVQIECREAAERITRRFEQFIAAHPAGQSDDDAERCIACDKPLKAGERVLPDAEGGRIHTACCGPERESYTKGHGEPLGPNDPIPQGYVYDPEPSHSAPVCNGDPAGQSTGLGAGIGGQGIPARLDAIASGQGTSRGRLLQISDGKVVNAGPSYSDPEAGKMALAPAPDSFRTGPVGTEDAEQRITNIANALASARRQRGEQERRAVAAEQRIIELEQGKIHPALAVDVQEHRNQAYRTGWDDGYAEGHGKATADALAARPAAPEAQGAWSFDMEAAPRDGTPLDLWSRPSRFINYRWDREGRAGGWWSDVRHKDRHWRDREHLMPASVTAWRLADAPPSSGQEG